MPPQWFHGGPRAELGREAVWSLRPRMPPTPAPGPIPSAYLPHVGQTRLELLPGVPGVADIHQLPLHRGGGVKRHLLAPIHTGHRGPDADGAPEVLGDIGGDHVLHTDVEVLEAVDLEAGSAQNVFTQGWSGFEERLSKTHLKCRTLHGLEGQRDTQ